MPLPNALAAQLEAGQPGRDQAAHRVLPYNMDAERALLGAVMVQNDAYHVVSQIVEAEHFMEPVHQRMWEAIADLIETESVATPITLKTYLGEADLGGATPMQYLARLAAEATTVVNAPQYAKIIYDLALRRRVISITQGVQDAAYEPRIDLTASHLVDRLENEIEEARPRAHTKRTGFRPLKSVSRLAVDAMQDEWNGTIVRRNVLTGYDKIDRFTGGFAPGDLIVIGGRPSMGKTALAIDIAVNAGMALVAVDGQDPGCVAIFSAEMQDTQLAERILSRFANVSGSRIRQRRLETHHVERIVVAARDLHCPIEIDHTGGIGIAQIQSRSRRLHRRKPIKLLVIDYLQLLGGFLARSKERNRSTELSEITGALKQLAKDLDCPVVLLSQVGRQVEDRPDLRPTLRDLKESGSIEQDADTVMFVFREEFYVLQREVPEGMAKREEWKERLEEVRGHGQIIVAKQRSGRTGTIGMGYNGALTHWLNEAPEQKARQDESTGERQRKEPPLPAAAEILMRDIRSMILNIGQAVTDDQIEDERLKGRSVPANARLVDRKKVFDEWRSTRMSDVEEEAARKEFQSIIDKIRVKGKLHSMGSKDTTFWYWMPELAAK